MKKILSIFVLVLILTFATKAFASLTFTTNAITGTTASSIDLGAGNTLSLNTTNNAPITTGTGLFTAAGGVSSILFTGPVTALKSTTTSIDVSSATAPTVGQVLTATGGAAATWQNIGLDKQIIFNDNGIISGSSIVTFNKLINDDGPAYFSIVGSLPTGQNVDPMGLLVDITPTSSTDISGQYAGLFHLQAGYTGNPNGGTWGGGTAAINGINETAGIGTNYPGIASSPGNSGGIFSAWGEGSGFNAGVYGNAGGSLTFNVGVFGFGGRVPGAKSIGVVGYGSGSTTNAVGGYFALPGNGAGSNPVVTTSAALIADNTTLSAPIALFRDNGTPVFTIADGGAVTSTSTVTSTQYKLSALNTAPATSSEACTTGEIRYTATYIYLCSATNTWVRSAFSSF